MKLAEKKFSDLIGNEWQGATPGLCIQAFRGGRKVIDLEIGKTYPFYDLASLTKIVFSAASLMFLQDQNLFRVSDPISKWVSWYPNRNQALTHFLSHSAGLTWWRPFYEKISKETTPRTRPEAAWKIFSEILKDQILVDQAKTEKKAVRAVYSDLDLFVIGLAMGEIAQADLYSVWTEARERMGLANTDFHRGNKPPLPKRNYAPTERDETWRKTTLQGAVHDENAFALKGVAPHAGLFGPIAELSQFGLLLRGGIRGVRSHRFARPETVRLFTTRAVPRTKGDWALGFMMPTPGAASCGSRFSMSSVGHTGFTGTSLWYDPKQDLLVTILSNRVHPTRENKAFVKLRPRLHDWVVEALDT